MCEESNPKSFMICSAVSMQGSGYLFIRALTQELKYIPNKLSKKDLCLSLKSL